MLDFAIRSNQIDSILEIANYNEISYELPDTETSKQEEIEFCYYCGAELAQNKNYCEKCGKQLDE